VTDPPAESEVVVSAFDEGGHWLPEIDGTGPAGTSFTVLVDDLPMLEVTVGADGLWRVVVDAAPGAHEIALHVAGDRMPVGSVDLRAPRVPTTTHEGTNRPGVVLTMSRGTAIVATVDGESTGRTHTNADGGSVRHLVGYAPGEHVVRLRYADPDTGRRSAAVERVVTVGDKPAPRSPSAPL
jgi:hypothetical protein